MYWKKLISSIRDMVTEISQSVDLEYLQPQIILGIHLSERISNSEDRRRCGDPPIVFVIVKQRRLGWFGHTMCKSDGQISKRCLKGLSLSAWKKRTGGQKKIWVATAKFDLEPNGVFRKQSHCWD